MRASSSGVKVSIATTNAATPGGQFVLGARALPGNPYDGHTLAAQIAQTERITGVAVERTYVDRGYRGHDAERHRVFISRQKRGITPTIRRELRRRNAVEPLIGHMKSDGHLDRNFLLRRDGDAINALLAAAGHNLRLLRRWLAQLFAVLLAAMLGAVRTPPAGLTNAASARSCRSCRPRPTDIVAASDPCEHRPIATGQSALDPRRC